MKYCEGDIVRVREDIEDLYADENTRRCYDITNDMSKMCGKLLTIDCIDEDYYHTDYAYVVRENSWFWQGSLLLPANSSRDNMENML